MARNAVLRNTLGNLVLLCRHHHTATHLRGTTMTGTARCLTITLPNGRVLTSEPPSSTKGVALGAQLDLSTNR